MHEQVAEPSLQARLDSLAARVREETQVPGISLGVSAGGRRTLAAAGTQVVGEERPLTIDCRYELGCASKLPLAIAAHELARRGRLDLCDPIGEYLPEPRGSPHGGAVRCEHLLSHTSGYRGTSIFDEDTRAFAWNDLVRYLERAPRLFAPGAVFSYEHTESVLLAEIVRRVGGASDRTGDARATPLAGRHRFDERAGRFVALDDGAPMAPFWQAAFSARRVTIGDLLAVGETAVQVAELQHSVVRLPQAAGGPLRELLPVAFGLGSAELRGDYRGSTGVSAGQCVGIRFCAAKGICAAVGLNAMVPYLRDFVLTALCTEVAGRLERDEPEPFGFELRDLTGQYLGPGTGLVDVRFADDRLICRLGHEGRPGDLHVDLVLDDDGRAVLRSPLPHLSLAFFTEAREGAVGLMLGLSAYRRVAR